jgi:hypothetical protein
MGPARAYETTNAAPKKMMSVKNGECVIADPPDL